jgi:hypothetical protein
MPYTIYDSIKDEIDFLNTLKQVEENEGNTFAATITNHLERSLRRVLFRVERGYDYDIVRDKVTGKPSIGHSISNRKKLEDEYPALRQAAENYNLVQNLIDSTP